MGILHDFLRLNDYDSPLHGRPLYTITVQPFSKELLIRFMKKGFEEAEMKINFDLSDVVSQINGIPGYLVLFGLKYIETESVERALEEVFSTMSVLFEKELEELDKRSRRYRLTPKLIASGVKNWADIKRHFTSARDPISDSRLHSLLFNLEKMSFIEKTKEGYKLADPILSKVLSKK